MPLQKDQTLRLLRIVARLKENCYPNAQSMVKEFRDIDIDENINISCTTRTVQRDFELLKNEFNCPLKFDRARNGYYLVHHNWDFVFPSILTEDEMFTAIIGAKIAEYIFPAPLKNTIRHAVDVLLQKNNTKFLNTANLNSIAILTKLSISIDSDIFMTLFNGWKLQRCVKITYLDTNNNESTRIIEPHSFVFFENAWYSKGLCQTKNAIRTFALHRIQSAELLPQYFMTNNKIIKTINTDDFLDYDKIQDIKLEIDPSLKEHLKTTPLHSRQVIRKQTLEIPQITKNLLFSFLLSQQGKAKLISHPEIQKEFKEKLQQMLNDYAD